MQQLQFKGGTSRKAHKETFLLESFKGFGGEQLQEGFILICTKERQEKEKRKNKLDMKSE